MARVNPGRQRERPKSQGTVTATEGPLTITPTFLHLLLFLSESRDVSLNIGDNRRIICIGYEGETYFFFSSVKTSSRLICEGVGTYRRDQSRKRTSLDHVLFMATWLPAVPVKLASDCTRVQHIPSHSETLNRSCNPTCIYE